MIDHGKEPTTEQRIQNSVWFSGEEGARPGNKRFEAAVRLGLNPDRFLDGVRKANAALAKLHEASEEVADALADLKDDNGDGRTGVQCLTVCPECDVLNETCYNCGADMLCPKESE